ncbi:hypothetical protein IF1G_03151 [Cordyceps javanica]|uniref:Uncharacterized protein n=1 Tax=Cordyceps javanica TaxID=43265 RepID=A0A545V6R7_9HYPO|nr:hypothetical protein IF1G_03151 [Cordyceps javanica]
MGERKLRSRDIKSSCTLAGSSVDPDLLSAADSERLASTRDSDHQQQCKGTKLPRNKCLCS